MIYPRVLVVSSSNFNQYTGAGILLTNLFKGWPISNIAIIHKDDFSNNESLCNRTYKLSFKDYSFPLSILACIEKKIGKIENFNEEYSVKSARKISAPANTKVKLRTIYEKVNGVIGGPEIYSKYVVSQQLMDWINQFNPQILYCHVSSLMNIRFVSKIQKSLKIPLCIHIMDDFFNVRYSTGFFSAKLKVKFYNEFKSLLLQTSLRMGIGRKMCDAYEKKFGFSFEPFSNAVDPASWLKYNHKNKTKSGKFKIVYAGTINTKNVSNLKVLSEIAEQINNEKNNCEFEIRTFNPRVELYRPILERKPSVTIAEVPGDDKDMISLLRKADLLFLPVDFTNVSIERMRFSIFAKLPAYMMSGTPILVYGPPDVASIEYAIEEKWAYVVAIQDKIALKKAINKLVSDPGLREKLGRRAQEIGLRDFDANKIRKRFSEELAKAAFPSVFKQC